MIINTDLIYPVGAIYISVSPINPKTLFGGEWESINSRFLIGTGEATGEAGETYNFIAGNTGGEYSHRLTVAEMPSHSHAIRSGYGESGTSDAYRYQYWGSSALGWKTGNLGTNSTGGDGYHNNLPPFLVVYM